MGVWKTQKDSTPKVACTHTANLTFSRKSLQIENGGLKWQ
nr:MAG TPA: hypothetical protein [Caudoviricetes sp.]